ncbi:CDP-glycerol glycerophosphotransferase (TagB/SpsB family)/glycosyltransferase involved in cell wall biosynthesis [Paenibacillus favisporus]|uniref:CDP-glycerol glycerophosphotransferase (TagB/SpsB family)/glycosyltransferase involved in cell wall biosynthesis n=1 Tax=Paenibacillus favisporus TaxID=221028 RepID=A0ABV2F8S0_9BACL
MLQERDAVYDYLFSIIMPIYNVEKYLEEAIESVIYQSIGFEDHVQLILINDGSTDSSEEICLRYKNKYLNNIVYIYKENEGVSSTRNEGLKEVRGKYVGFLDADDMFSTDALLCVVDFFEENFKYIDLVSIPLYFFDAINKPHHLNYKYKNTRIVNILKEYKSIQMHIGGSFIKNRILKNHRFNPEMKLTEDAELINKIILEKCSYGVVKEAQYLYRKRQNNSSAIRDGFNKKEWYTKYLNTFSRSTIKYANDKMGFLPKYIQYMVMYDLQWRFNLEKIPENLLTYEEENEFFQELINVLQYIDDSIIMEQTHLNYQRKLFVLRLKYSANLKLLERKISTKGNLFLHIGNVLLNEINRQNVTIELFNIKNDTLIIEGFFGSGFNNSEIQIICQLDEDIIVGEKVDRTVDNIYSLGRVIKEYYGFKFSINLNDNYGKSICFFALGGEEKYPLSIKFRKYSRLTTENYLSESGYIFRANKDKISIKKASLREKVANEFNYLKYLIKSKELGSRKAVIVRVSYYLFKLLYKGKKIWLFMDRQDKADDNAEHLFLYSNNQNDNIKKYFVIKKDSKDYSRLKKIAAIIDFGSYRHKFLHLVADKIISSHADEWVTNPFFSLDKYYKDLIGGEFIFLQHGIIKDDLSSWLNKYRKNISLFITSTNAEYNSIINGTYNYSEENVKLTGLPRYDNLENKNRKQILIIPTWRKSIVKPKNQQLGERPYNESFKQSEYFKNYNRLINDSNLIEKAKSKNYEIIFFPHPDIYQQLVDFDRNDYVKFVDYNISYQQLFNESSLLITDYSSVAFDFAYLSKPVLYFQFDRNHYNDGYFDYESMGFGEVCNEYDELLLYINFYIDNDCIMKPMYAERVKDFYAFTDRNNCLRVYEEIIKLK